MATEMTTKVLNYLGNSTTQTLDKLEIYESSVRQRAEYDGSPSLQETKIARVELPEEQPVVPNITLEDLTLAKEESNCESVSRILEKYGVCIIKNFLSQDQVNEVNQELDPHFAAKKNDPRLFPKETIRVSATVNKSPAVVRDILANPLNIEVSEKFLSKKNAFWIGNNLNVGYAPAIVTSSIAFRVGPNAQSQLLHRDDQSDHNIKKREDVYRYGRESQMGISVALSKVTKENGGTRFIPGSHLWDHLRQPHDEQCMQVELDEGDGFFMLASTVHGASPNYTNEDRTLVIVFMCSGNVRQKENIYLETPIEYWKQFTAEELRLLGLSMSEPFSGMLELQDPLVTLKPGYVRRSNYTDICKVEPK